MSSANGRANLSRDYFTNRQDRYHLFKSKELTDYYALLHQKLRTISYQLHPAPDRPERFRLDWPVSNVSSQFNAVVNIRAVQSRIYHLMSTVLMPQNFFLLSFDQQNLFLHPQLRH